MKLQLTIDGTDLLTEFSSVNHRAHLTIASNSHEADLAELRPGVINVILNGKVYRCTSEKLPSGETEVFVNGNRFRVGIQDPKRLSHNTKGSGQNGGKASLESPMPGKVVRVLCAVGDQVSEGQGILVVEAMKMQNEVQAPKSGNVAELRVTEGQTVNAGEILAVVE